MVDLRSAERQALGKSFVPGPFDEKLVADLLKGQLTLSPHKSWSLPHVPTWTENPFSDNNWQFQYHMLRWLDPLRRAARSGNEHAAEAWERYARSWIEANPPGQSESRWAWVDMADGIRALELCHGLGVVGEQEWLVHSLEQHHEWLSDPTHYKRGNHGLHQTLGLFVLSAVLEDQTGMDTAVSWLGERLRESWDEQGVNEEGALAYHRMNYLWWQEAMTRLDLEGVDRPDGAERLELAPEEMAHATSPLGQLARIGDTNGASIRDIQHPYSEYVTSAGTRGAAPSATTAIYDRGYAFVRSGWGQGRPFAEETYLTTVFGSQEKFHGHVDGGSLTCCAQGVQWLDDAGRYYYGRHPMQDYAKSRGAHSLVVLPGRTADKTKPVELMSSEITEDFTDLLLADHSYDDVKITRRIVYLKHWDLTVVLDKVHSDEPVQAEQRWHCGRGVKATPLSIGFSLKEDKHSFHLASLTNNHTRDVRTGQENPLIGWTATGWRKCAPVDVATVYDEGTDLIFGTLLGTWTPVAVDLMRQRLAEDPDLKSSLVNDLIPQALLRVPWPESHGTSPAKTPSKLKASAELVGPDTVKVVAEGPGKYFSFDLYDDVKPVYRVPWLARPVQALDLTGVVAPKLRVRNRTTPSDLQQITVSGEDWKLVLPASHASGTPVNETQTLILIETMFCDNERDPDVLAAYFERFCLCLTSLLALEVPKNAELLVTVYVSSDKEEYIRKIQDTLNSSKAGCPRLRIQVCEYDHPSEGYTDSDRIDWQKSPNKHAPYRDELFAKAHGHMDFSVYNRMIRMAIDDDDVLLREHPSNMLSMADAVQADAPDSDVIIMGPLRTYVAYIHEDGVDVEDVEMRRSLTGNKSYVIRDPSRTDLATLSPWSVPEQMTAVQSAAARRRGQELRPVHGNLPGFVYMRWGQNLSSQRKDFHITKRYGGTALNSVSEVLNLNPDQPIDGMTFQTVPLDIRISAHRINDDLMVSSNFEKLKVSAAYVCFQVYVDGQRIDSTSYSRKPTTTFSGVPAGAKVRGYVRLDGEIVGRCETSAP